MAVGSNEVETSCNQVNLEVAMDFCQAWNMQLISIETKVEDDMIFDTLAKGGQF